MVAIHSRLGAKVSKTGALILMLLCQVRTVWGDKPVLLRGTNAKHKLATLINGRQLQTRTVPFDIGALQYDAFSDSTEAHYGNCGAGPVDSKAVSDSICIERNGTCTVGWTKPGEWLQYAFSLEQDASVNIIARISSKRTNRQIAVQIDGAVVGLLDAPGAGFDNFQDQVIENVPVLQGDHDLRLFFENGNINVCSLSVTISALTPVSPLTPMPTNPTQVPAATPSPVTSAPLPGTSAPVPPTSSDGSFRLKMYHELGYFWQCDGQCDSSNPANDSDPMWCLQCDNTICQDGDYAHVRTCDTATANTGINTMFEFVPTELPGQFKIKDVRSNTCLTTENYTDKSNKMNTRMKTCVDESGSNQIYETSGDGDSNGEGRFEIHPQDNTKYCLTTHHHPKDGEDARVERCGLARKDNSSYFEKFIPM